MVYTIKSTDNGTFLSILREKANKSSDSGTFPSVAFLPAPCHFEQSEESCEAKISTNINKTHCTLILLKNLR